MCLALSVRGLGGRVGFGDGGGLTLLRCGKLFNLRQGVIEVVPVVSSSIAGDSSLPGALALVGVGWVLALGLLGASLVGVQGSRPLQLWWAPWFWLVRPGW